MFSSDISRLAAVAFLGVATLTADPVAAQIPEEFTNLQLLPKDIEQRKLVRTMRDWAGGLGVRCNHCHVGPENLQGMDFASDEKPTKRAARKRLAMARAINREYIGELPEQEARRQVASCYTCHRGMPKPPRSLGRALAAVSEAEGTDAALVHYRELREKHFAGGKYDFRAKTLNGVARRLIAAKRYDDAFTVLELNLEFYPDSANALATMGQAHLGAGDRDKAKEIFEKALLLDPEEWLARMGMERLQKPQ